MLWSIYGTVNSAESGEFTGAVKYPIEVLSPPLSKKILLSKINRDLPLRTSTRIIPQTHFVCPLFYVCYETALTKMKLLVIVTLSSQNGHHLGIVVFVSLHCCCCHCHPLVVNHCFCWIVGFLAIVIVSLELWEFAFQASHACSTMPT